MAAEELPELLTIAELAELARQSRRTIERRVQDGEIETVVVTSARARRQRAAGTVRITREEAARYLRGLRA